MTVHAQALTLEVLPSAITVLQEFFTERFGALSDNQDNSVDLIPHISVLLHESMQSLAIKPGGVYIDATFGSGGHTKAILEACAPDGIVIAFDRDPQAIAYGEKLSSEYPQRFILEQANFSELPSILAKHGYTKVDGILADLGVSTRQFLQAERGFSNRFDGPLDMRMGPDAKYTALEYLQQMDPAKFAQYLKQLGEPRRAQKVAHAISQAVHKNPNITTKQLVDAIQYAYGPKLRYAKKDLSSLVFLAIRMAVNEELEHLETFLQTAPSFLKAHSRFAIITFHSTEDRMVKKRFRHLCLACTCPPQFPICQCGGKPKAKNITKKGITPSHEELSENPRSRSATLRVIEMLEEVQA